jgi:hypothetical protein
MTDTDHELLELAYRAWAPGQNYIRLINDAGRDYWNPLEDNGDAFRLAVSLRMIVTPGAAMMLKGRLFGKDKDSAEETRRAIVMAAAEIGRTMQ